MNINEFIGYLYKLMDENKLNEKELAYRIGISPSYLSDVLKKNRKPGEKFLRGLGFMREDNYKMVSLGGRNDRT